MLAVDPVEPFHEQTLEQFTPPQTIRLPTHLYVVRSRPRSEAGDETATPDATSELALGESVLQQWTLDSLPVSLHPLFPPSQSSAYFKVHPLLPPPPPHPLSHNGGLNAVFLCLARVTLTAR